MSCTKQQIIHKNFQKNFVIVTIPSFLFALRAFYKSRYSFQHWLPDNYCWRVLLVVEKPSICKYQICWWLLEQFLRNNCKQKSIKKLGETCKKKNHCIPSQGSKGPIEFRWSLQVLLGRWELNVVAFYETYSCVHKLIKASSPLQHPELAATVSLYMRYKLRSKRSHQ